MIKAFRHKAPGTFFRTGGKAGNQPHQAGKLRVMLFTLDNAKGPEDMNAPGWRLHPFERELAGHWSVWVNGNWRVTFTFEGEHPVLVDYQDYH